MLWWFSASAYNLLSILRGYLGLPALSPSQPLTGLLFVSLMPALLLLGRFKPTQFIWLFPVYGLLLGYSGIVKHLLEFSLNGLEGYASSAAFVMAISLNSFALLCSYFLWRKLIKGGYPKKS